MNDHIAYLNRTFGRLCDEAVQSAQKERMHVMAEASKHGALQGSRMLITVKDEYARTASETVK